MGYKIITVLDIAIAKCQLAEILFRFFLKPKNNKKFQWANATAIRLYWK